MNQLYNDYVVEWMDATAHPPFLWIPTSDSSLSDERWSDLDVCDTRMFVAERLISMDKNDKFIFLNHRFSLLTSFSRRFPKIRAITPKSSILIGFSIINHPAIGVSQFMELPMSFFLRVGREGTPHSAGGRQLS
jgi:hypothetical protein